ncbi:MAG: DUF2442 domain-containing protein [Verrucomicrobiota bacterium]
MMKFLHTEEAKYLDNYRVWLKFSDGSDGQIDLKNELVGSIFEPLQDTEYFEQFRLEGRTLTWPNEADFVPEYLHPLLPPIKAA